MGKINPSLVLLQRRNSYVSALFLPTISWLCDCRQVPSPFCTSVSSSALWIQQSPLAQSCGIRRKPSQPSAWLGMAWMMLGPWWLLGLTDEEEFESVCVELQISPGLAAPYRSSAAATQTTWWGSGWGQCGGNLLYNCGGHHVRSLPENNPYPTSA